MTSMELCELEPHSEARVWHEDRQVGKWNVRGREHSDRVDLVKAVYIAETSRPSRLSAEERFNALATKWRQDTLSLSSIHAIISHPAYLQIIAMGRKALPFIFGELRRRPELWFWALEAITGENPTDPGDEGNLHRMTSAWLKWAKENGFADRATA